MKRQISQADSQIKIDVSYLEHVVNSRCTRVIFEYTRPIRHRHVSSNSLTSNERAHHQLSLDRCLCFAVSDTDNCVRVRSEESSQFDQSLRSAAMPTVVHKDASMGNAYVIYVRHSGSDIRTLHRCRTSAVAQDIIYSKQGDAAVQSVMIRKLFYYCEKRLPMQGIS
jgi:hypothetical protein